MGSSHAIALTSATCSGGKTARATRARLVLQTLKTLLGEPSSPPADQSRRGIKPPGDLRVRHPVRSVEHDPSALHILKRKLLRASATLELRALLIAELDPVTTWTRHRHITSRDGTQLLHQSYDRYLRMRLLIWRGGCQVSSVHASPPRCFCWGFGWGARVWLASGEVLDVGSVSYAGVGYPRSLVSSLADACLEAGVAW
jgi:hypothetical protein